MSFKAREALRNMRTTDPEFWEELTRSQHDKQLPDVAETLQEDLEFDTKLEDKDADDSDVSMQTLITALTREDIPETVGFRKGGTLTSLTDAENVDLDEGMLPLAEANVEIPTIPRPSGDVGRGKRKKFASKRYNGEEFWRHNDDDDWEDDSLLPTR
jgi:hypothetical protein